MFLQVRSDLIQTTRKLTPSGLFSYTLYDPVREKYFILSQKYFEILRRVHIAPLKELVPALNGEGFDFTEEDVQGAVLYFQANNFLLGTTQARPQTGFIKFILHSYLYLKIPIIKPSGFFLNTAPAVKFVFNKLTLIILCIIALYGYALFLKNFSLFTSAISSSFSYSHFKYYAVAIIFIKVIHELAHSYTTAFFGVKVRSLGVAFIFFVPRLYSDVSDSVTLPPNKRLLIASAGIIAEFILGGLAAIVFLAFPQGQAISIIAASVTSVSLLLTLLFNANPFMRFDGYYMLSDALDIPNLSSRSKDCLKNVFHRVLWGEKFKKVPLQGFLTVFGFLSWCYRISLYTSFVVIIWHFQLKSLAIPLTILEIYIFFIGPIIQEIKFYQSKKRTIKMKHKVIFISLITALAGVLFIPVNLPVSAPAYVSSTEFGTELRSKINGTIKEVSGADILLTNPLLEYELDEGKLELDLYKQTESFYQSQKDYSLMLLQQQLQDKTTLKIDTLEDSKENLRVKYSGLIKEENLIGKYIPAGQIITRTYDPKTIYICTYIPAVDYKESISTGVLKFKYHDAFDVEVIKVITSPQLFLPECLIKRNGGFIEVTENRHPLATHYLLVLKLRNNTDKISNYSRSAEFIYHDKKSLFNTFYTQIASFISRELI